MQVLDILALALWSAGVFLAPLLTTMLPYRPGTWWLWPSLRVGWQTGGGVLAGMGTAHFAGAEPTGWVIGGVMIGGLGGLLSIASWLALFQGPRELAGELVGVQGHTHKPLPGVEPGMRVDTITVDLNTDEGHRGVRFRGLQGSYARRALAEHSPGSQVQLCVLAPLRAFVGVRVASKATP